MFFLVFFSFSGGISTWFSEVAVPPGNQFPGEIGKEVDPGDPAHIGPEYGFQETELKL
jgi:hypothetical protein